jgi:hypothetical protein
LPGRDFAKPEKLFQVMLPVHYMKLSPLRRTQRAQNRMVEHVDPADPKRLCLAPGFEDHLVCSDAL